jgi:type II secretory pathway predicted ATPase ExeA
MYESFFGLKRPPSDRQLSADQLFHTPALDELHSRLEYLVKTRSLGLLTGEPGSGKSTALRRLRDSLHPEKVRAVYLHDTAVNPADFFRQLALELGLVPRWSRTMAFRDVQQEIVRLEPLAQRISVRYALPRLDRDCARLYLEHRLRLAGLDRPLFSEPAIEALFSASGGLMRHLDTLAHHALAATASLRAKIVDCDHVVRAAEELRA